MAKTVSIEALGAAISEELTLYHKAVTDKVNDAGRKAVKDLVKKTRATAPVGARGSFKKSITYTETTNGNGMKLYTWGAKAPDHRLTHLLVHGHAAKDGGRVPGNSFLQNALDVVLPEYEEAIKEAIKNG